MSPYEFDAQTILEEMKEGSYSAFARFYERYADLVYRVALQRTGDAAEAEDVCQDVFLSVMDKPGRYDPARGTVEAWLVVMTKSRSLDRLRRRKRIQLEAWEEQSLAAVTGSTAPIDETVLSRLELESLRRALRGMPSHQQKVLVGAYLEERSHRELAESLQRPIGTVKSWIRNGLQQLRRSLESGGSAHD